MSYSVLRHKRAAVSRKPYKHFLWIVPTLILLLGTAYSVAVYFAVAPAPEIRVVAEDKTFVAPADELENTISALALPTAVAWSNSEEVFSNSDDPLPLASVSKIISLLVALDYAPLDPDPANWEPLVITDDDYERALEYRAEGGVSYLYPPGSVIPLEDVFYLTLVPSANDIAAAYSYSVFGTRENFMSAVAAFATKNDMDSLVLYEPTGMDERNVASPSDLIKVGRLAIGHPVLSEVIQTQEVLVEGAGLLENTNPLLAEDSSVIGVKTGRTATAGFNFLVAAKHEVGGRELAKVAALLARPTLEDRALDGQEILALMDSAPKTFEILSAGDVVAEVSDALGNVVEITLPEDLETVLLPAEQVVIAYSFFDGQELSTAGTVVGEVSVTLPGATADDVSIETFELKMNADLFEPDFFWKLKNPQLLNFF